MDSIWLPETSNLVRWGILTFILSISFKMTVFWLSPTSQIIYSRTYYQYVAACWLLNAPISWSSTFHYLHLSSDTVVNSVRVGLELILRLVPVVPTPVSNPKHYYHNTPHHILLREYILHNNNVQYIHFLSSLLQDGWLQRVWMILYRWGHLPTNIIHNLLSTQACSNPFLPLLILTFFTVGFA